MSKKFTAAQHNYRVFEMETIAILEVLKWEDKLIGNQINVVTDHRALEFFKTQRKLSSCQMQWMEYLSWFDYDIQYVKGVNKVADSLSRYYQSDTGDDVHPLYDFVNADVQLDLEGEDLPWNHIVEIWVISDHPQRSPLRKAMEERDMLAESFANANKPLGNPLVDPDDDDPTIFESISQGTWA
jgi:hypothetical protein